MKAVHLGKNFKAGL